MRIATDITDYADNTDKESLDHVARLAGAESEFAAFLSYPCYPRNPWYPWILDICLISDRIPIHDPARIMNEWFIFVTFMFFVDTVP